MSPAITTAFILVLVTQICGFPRSVSDRHSLVLSRATRQIDQPHDGKESSSPPKAGIPKIYEMRVDVNITNRFAHALVTSKVRNLANNAQETVFSIVLPKDAFISKFVMSIKGKEYDAYVKKRKDAQKIYDDAIASGQSAGLVSASARESNRFTVAVNVEPSSKITFHLAYEQLLQRSDHQYELVINIHPKQPVKDLTVHVNITESQPLRFVNAPPIRSGNDIIDFQGDLDPRAQISMVNPNSALVKFSPNLERQKELANVLGTNVDEGLSGQFVVQYDVERNSSGGEILLNDGYFVHFFAPPGSKYLPKYVLFVLDTSGSMIYGKIDQLKAAMKNILGELRKEDKFHLVEFNTLTKVWDLQEEYKSVNYPSEEPAFYGETEVFPKENIALKQFPTSSSVNPNNIKEAVELVDRLGAGGGTNIADALKVALYLVEVDKRSNPAADAPQPIIIFLTDGEATIGETRPQAIIDQVREDNRYNTPIYCLSFGNNADKDLLQKLSLRNNGFSRHIYEAADASLQLQDFYRHISSPVLRNVTFKYVEDVKEISQTSFPILFDGGEFVIVGQLGGNKQLNTLPTISGFGIHGPIEVQPEVRQPVTRLERLWAYKTIQLLLQDMEKADNKTELEEKALGLALNYSFVTPLSSLVVVKPNATDSIIVPVPADNDGTIAAGDPVLSLPSTYNLPAPQYQRGPSPAIYSANRGSVSKPYFYSTTTPILTTTTLSPPEKLKSGLQWLDTVLKGDVITTPTGTYKLGLNETSTEETPCPATPNNGPGLCKLLHECPEVHYLLTNIYIFQQFHCELRGFAAVCCPTVPAN